MRERKEKERGKELTAFVGVFDTRDGVPQGLAGGLTGFSRRGALASWYGDVMTEGARRSGVCEAAHV